MTLPDTCDGPPVVNGPEVQTPDVDRRARPRTRLSRVCLSAATVLCGIAVAAELTGAGNRSAEPVAGAAAAPFLSSGSPHPSLSVGPATATSAGAATAAHAPPTQSSSARISSAPSSSAPSSSAPSSSSAVGSSPTGSSTTDSTSAPLSPTTTTVAPDAGSVAVGDAAYPVPADAVFVSPGGSDAAAGTLGAPLRTVAAALVKAPTGATIVLRGGVYHESVRVSKNGQTIEAYPHEQVWFDGSSAVAQWSPSDGTWVHAGWTTQFDHSASFSRGRDDPSFISPDYPMAAYPDQVFVDGVALAQVPSTPGPGQFAVDYAAQTLTLGSDPTGHEVRASDLETAVTLAGAGDSLLGVGVRRYGTPIWAVGSVRAWAVSASVRDVVVTDSAAICLTADKPGVVLSHVTTMNCGLEGIHANQADGLLLDSALVVQSNSEHFNHAPAAAGIKISRTLRLTVTNSDVHDSYDATGIWLDESDRNFVVANNRSVNNRNAIQAELSDGGIIANNVFDGGEYGVWLHNTGDTEVYNNVIRNIWSRGVAMYQDARRQATFSTGRDPRMPVPDPTCPWVVHNIVVANNTFTAIGKYQIYAMDGQSNVSADAMDIRLQGNLFAYKTSRTAASLILWGAGDNVSKTIYETPAEFASAQGVSWQNMQTTTGTASGSVVGQLSVSDSMAVPLPADVAAAVGQSPGVQHLGTF